MSPGADRLDYSRAARVVESGLWPAMAPPGRQAAREDHYRAWADGAVRQLRGAFGFTKLIDALANADLEVRKSYCGDTMKFRRADRLRHYWQQPAALLWLRLIDPLGKRPVARMAQDWRAAGLSPRLKYDECGLALFDASPRDCPSMTTLGGYVLSRRCGGRK